MAFLESMGLSALDGAIGVGGTMLQNFYNKQMAQYQNDYNTQMWHMQNEYNSPKATMNRLVEAGINPRAYQQIGQFANAGTPPPAAQNNKLSELSAFQGVVRQGLENQLLAKELEDKDSKISLNAAKEFLTSLQAAWGEDQNEHKNVRNLAFMLFNGINPLDLYGEDDLNNYRRTGLPKMYYDNKGRLLGHYRGTQLFKNRGVDLNLKILLKGLRDAEKKLKDGEVSDFENFGIRGNSDYVNIVRFIFEVTGIGDKLADWVNKRKKK